MVNLAIWKTCSLCGSKKAEPIDIEDLRELDGADTGESYLAAIKAAYSESFPTHGPKMVAVWRKDNGEVTGAVVDHICGGKCKDKASKAFESLFGGPGKPAGKRGRKPADPNAPAKKRGRKPKAEQQAAEVEAAQQAE